MQIISTMKKGFVLALLGLVFLIACNPTPLASPLASPIQSPVASPQPEFQAPAPALGKALVVGILMNENTDQPMAGVELYLGDHIGATSDTPMYGLDPSVAPRTTTDQDGRFVFADVDPGSYVIIVWNPFNSYMLQDPATGAELSVILEADEVFDVGVLSAVLP